MAYIVMTHTVMAYAVMVCVVTAYRVTALYSYGLRREGIDVLARERRAQARDGKVRARPVGEGERT